MAVPLTILDTLFRDEASLERDELSIRALDALGGFNELADRVCAEMQEPLDPAQDDMAVRRLWELIEEFFEFLLSLVLLFVELAAGFLKLVDGFVQRREVNGKGE